MSKQESERTIKILIRHLTYADLSEITSLSVNQLRALRAAGKLPPATKVGSQLRWHPDAVAEWLRANTERDA